MNPAAVIPRSPCGSGLAWCFRVACGLFLLPVCGQAWSLGDGGAAAKPGAVAVELASERLACQPRKPCWIGLRMQHDPHWHTYWKNPGDAGIPTTLAWTLPPGFAAGDIEWPYPARLPRGPLASYGYEGEALLPVLLYPRAGVRPPTRATVVLRAAWLECRDNCVPREATLTLDLPISATTAGPARHARLFRETRERLPQAHDGIRASAARRGDTVEVDLDLPEPVGRRGELFFEAEDFVEPGQPPAVEARPGGARWASRLTANGRRSKPGNLAAVWVAASPGDGKTRAWRVDVRLGN